MIDFDFRNLPGAPGGEMRFFHFMSSICHVVARQQILKVPDRFAGSLAKVPLLPCQRGLEALAGLSVVEPPTPV
jgi:hypothetical protein